MAKITNNHIQLFRNSKVFDNRAAAIAKLDSFKSTEVQDGTPVLARYTQGGTTKTLLALFYVTDSSIRYDIVGDSADINSAIAALEAKLLGGASNDFNTLKKLEDKITVLNGADTVDGSVAKAVKDAVTALDVDPITETGKAIVSVSETDGKVSATTGDISAEHVIQDAAKGDTQAVTVKKAIDDLRTTVAANQVVKGDASVDVAAKDGKTSVKVALADGEKVLSVDGGLKTTIALAKITTGLDANTAVAYQLQGKGGAQLGTVQIEIPKDRSLKEVYLGTTADTVDEATGVATKTESNDPQSLNFVYHLETGKYSIAKVDVSKFLSESEFADGLNVVDHVVKVKVADDSEAFLKVGAGGVKLEGVQAAIDAAKASATTVVTAAADTHISVSESTEDGHKKFTVSDNVNGGNVILKDYTAATSGTPAATDSVNGAISKLFNLINSGDKKINDELDAAEIAIGLNADGTKVASTGHYTSGAQTIEDEIAALDTQVKTNEDTIAANKVVAGNGISVANATSTGTTVSAKINTESGLAVTADKGIEIASIDAGTY